MSIDLLSAFMIGMLGSGHCLSMCGGITTMLTAALPQNNTQSKLPLIFYYNIGRISTYALIGGIVGFSSSIAAKNMGIPLAGMRILAALFLILLGLYLGQWLMWLNRVEYLGQFLWKKISPVSQKLIPVDTKAKALGLGGLWGWLPCGLVYSTLTWSLASGNALSGAAIMAFFGLGTLPALLSVSLGLFHINSLIKKTFFRKIAAIFIILYGIYSLVIAYRLVF